MNFAARPIPSPEIRTYLPLLANLVRRDLKLKYKSSILGFAWSLANPMLILAAYSVAFQYVLRVDIPAFPLFFFVAYLPWSFFATALTAATGSILSNENLVAGVAFRTEVIPLATVFSHAIEMLLAGAVLLPFLALAHRAPLTGVVLTPLLVGLHVLFTAGIALVFAAIHVRLRDTLHLVQVGLTITFWATPIVYPLEMASDRLRTVLWLNPMTWFVEAYRAALFHGVWPGTTLLTGLGVWASAAAVVGFRVFARNRLRIAEHV